MNTDVRKRLEEHGYQEGDLIPVRVVADVWGVTPNQIRQLAIDPTSVEEAEGDTWTFFSYAQVLELYGDPRVAAARRRQGEDHREEWHPPIAWRDALPAAACAMIALGTQGDAHGGDAQRLSLELRRRFLRCLWDHGYCRSVARTTEQVEEYVCYRCRGVGCEACEYSGIWWRRREVEGYMLTFDLPSGDYCVPAALGELPWASENLATQPTLCAPDGVRDPDPWFPHQYRGDKRPRLVIAPMAPRLAVRILQWTIEQAEQAA